LAILCSFDCRMEKSVFYESGPTTGKQSPK
jgi:hypothetical protein